MGRNKKSGNNWLTHRLLNPDRARADDEAHQAFVKAADGLMPSCMECGGTRRAVAVADVPEEVRAPLLARMGTNVDFTLCSACGRYSALTKWQGF